MTFLRCSVSAALLVFALGACKKDAADHQRTWKNNYALVSVYGGKYSQFKAAIDKQATAAKAIYDKALSSKGDAQLAKYKEANDALLLAVGGLKTYEGKLEEIGKLKRDRAVNRNSALKVNAAIRLVNSKMEDAAEEINSEEPVADAAAMAARVSKANSLLETGITKLRQLKRKGTKKTTVKRKKRKKRKK